MQGIIPVYKPVGMTSYDVLRIFKKNNPPQSGEKRWKIGHGGTLDPFACGVLLVLIGRGGTKQFDTLRMLPKTYLATALVGASSDTLDCTGTISMSEDQNVRWSDGQMVNKIKEVIPRFIGEIEQVVPAYSAAKVVGKPRYKYAREGKTLASTSKKVQIYELELVGYEHKQAKIKCSVSSGTYIRQLSYDLFKELGFDSYLTTLERTQIGDLGLDSCCTINDLSDGNWTKYLIPSTEQAK